MISLTSASPNRQAKPGKSEPDFLVKSVHAAINAGELAIFDNYSELCGICGQELTAEALHSLAELLEALEGKVDVE